MCGNTRGMFASGRRPSHSKTFYPYPSLSSVLLIGTEPAQSRVVQLEVLVSKHRLVHVLHRLLGHFARLCASGHGRLSAVQAGAK